MMELSDEGGSFSLDQLENLALGKLHSALDEWEAAGVVSFRGNLGFFYNPD